MLTLASPSQSKPIAPTARRLTVCQVVHGLPVGGAEVLVSRTIRALRDRYRFVVACLDQVGELGDALVDEGIAVVNLGRRPGLDWRCVRRLHQLLASETVDVIHAHQYTPFAYSVATRAFGRRPPVLFTEHGRFFPDYPSFKRRVFNRLVTSRRDRYVAVGQSVRRALIDNEGLSPKRIDVVYNGIDTTALTPNADLRQEVRRELGLGDEFAVMQVARLDSIKDHATAVRAIKAAARQRPDIRLFIIGDGPERPSIESVIAELGLQNRVTLLGTRSDVRRLLAAADGFLLTSVSEGIPVTIIEAMAAGVPVVSTSVGGIPEMLKHETTGLLANTGDAQGLADNLVRLADDGPLQMRLSAAAKARAEAKFSEYQMLAAYCQIYDSMVGVRKI